MTQQEYPSLIMALHHLLPQFLVCWLGPKEFGSCASSCRQWRKEFCEVKKAEAMQFFTWQEGDPVIGDVEYFAYHRFNHIYMSMAKAKFLFILETSDLLSARILVPTFSPYRPGSHLYHLYHGADVIKACIKRHGNFSGLWAERKIILLQNQALRVGSHHQFYLEQNERDAFTKIQELYQETKTHYSQYFVQRCKRR